MHPSAPPSPLPGLPHNAMTAFAAYEAVRHRLPQPIFPAQSRHFPSLADVADHVDGFLLDAFGVLNVGDTAIPGAVQRMADLRARGKRLVVLTNAASYTRPQLLTKYHRLGFDFTVAEVVSSRDVAAPHLPQIAPGAVWAALSAEGDSFDDIDADLVDAFAHPQMLRDADAFVFLSTARWTTSLQSDLIAALRDRPRPIVIANPDIVAPREVGLSLEPGLFVHLLLDALPHADVHWFGKPFGACFTQGLGQIGLPPDRVAMVGDTLHTDVLGGAAAGCVTVLVADHGLFRGQDVGAVITASGIIPDYVVRTT